MSLSTLTPKTTTQTNTTATIIDRSALPRQIAYMVLNVTDMPKALDFYKNTLGLVTSYESDKWVEMPMGVTLALKLVTGACSTNSCSSTNTNIETSHKTGISYHVSSINKSYETMKALNVKLLGEPAAACEGNMAFQFQDPFGNIFSAYGKA